MTPTEIERSEWAQGFAYECNSEFGKALAYAIEEYKFLIYHVNDLDVPLWAIAPASNQDFWMAAYDQLDHAIKLCETMGWRYDVCE